MIPITPEPPYAFRRFLDTPHHPDQRSPTATSAPGEVTIDEGWEIVVERTASDLIRHVARDLQDYFGVCMQRSLRLRAIDDLAGHLPALAHAIVLTTAADHPIESDVPAEPRGYHLRIDETRIVLCGRDDLGTAQASYFLEDLLNLRTGPFLTPVATARTPIFSPRMTHSGWGLDEFPDGHLNAIAHAGMDAILVFASDVDRTPDESINRHPERHGQGRYRDINALVDRATIFGLDVYLYAYFHGKKPVHPEDPGAERFYEETYGALFAACPRAKGIVLVGESVEFPSHDPNTTGRLRVDPEPGHLPTSKPSPGWWPSADYPQWVAMVADVCRRHKPDAEIIFWTYNWGYAPEADRLALIRSLPTDITLQVTFEMFEPITHDGVTNVCVDYTASSVGPGHYFASEAAVAHERGIRLHTMANTGGLTWDFGCIPFQPIPQQWNRRHQALRAAHEAWGLSGIMESHHYGWWPSFVSDLAKWNYWLPTPDPTETISQLARRDFGDGAAQAVAAWDAWSDATSDYVPTNEDQYGPFRIGPAYPLAFLSVPTLAVSDHAMFGDLIVKIPYEPELNPRHAKTAPAIRINAEIASMTRMAARWEVGNRMLEQANALAPDYRRERNDHLANLGRYILHAIRTTIHVKEWWKLRSRILIESDPVIAGHLLDELAAVGHAERTNAMETIPIVEADSRLGWEPTMDYLGDAAHIRWKIAHLDHALEREIPAYRASLTI